MTSSRFTDRERQPRLVVLATRTSKPHGEIEAQRELQEVQPTKTILFAHIHPAVIVARLPTHLSLLALTPEALLASGRKADPNGLVSLGNRRGDASGLAHHSCLRSVCSRVWAPDPPRTAAAAGYDISSDESGVVQYKRSPSLTTNHPTHGRNSPSSPHAVPGKVQQPGRRPSYYSVMVKPGGQVVRRVGVVGAAVVVMAALSSCGGRTADSAAEELASAIADGSVSEHPELFDPAPSAKQVAVLDGLHHNCH